MLTPSSQHELLEAANYKNVKEVEKSAPRSRRLLILNPPDKRTSQSPKRDWYEVLKRKVLQSQKPYKSEKASSGLELLMIELSKTPNVKEVPKKKMFIELRGSQSPEDSGGKNLPEFKNFGRLSKPEPVPVPTPRAMLLNVVVHTKSGPVNLLAQYPAIGNEIQLYLKLPEGGLASGSRYQCFTCKFTQLRFTGNGVDS
ncbi:hypothetical protein J6590_032951 [Homalodisca vitripennis]|nr:hypothetical protein J6590_032951 [Homalodisca vitripennis]